MAGSRALLWLPLGALLVLFYTTFVTARTYYNPSATLAIVILGTLISIGGLLSSRYAQTRSSLMLLNPVVSKVRSGFTLIFLLTVLVLCADVLLTLYAVSSFGFQVEANKVVASLIRSGNTFAWMWQHFVPVLVTGILFTVSKNLYLRTTAAFFTLGTLGYALVTVLNNIIVVYDLSSRA